MDWSLLTEDERREFLALYQQTNDTDLDQLFQYAVRRGGPFTVPVADLYTAMLLNNSSHQLKTYNRSDLVNMTSADISHFENLFGLDPGNARNKNRIIRILGFAGLIESNLALTEKYIPEWLNSIGLSPNQESANIAAADGNLKVLQWLYSRGILPDIRGINNAAMNGHVNVSRWLGRKGLFPDMYGINHAASRGHSGILKWLAGMRIFPDINGG